MNASKKKQDKHRGISGRVWQLVKSGWVWQLVVGLLLIGAIVWWLMLPASKATIAISAHTGSLTLDVLCGERLVWDLPAGRIGPRSALPGAGPARAGNVTLVLTAGARVRLESTGPGVLHLAIERVEGIARSCGADSVPSFQAILDGIPLADDPLGFSYAATAPETGQGSHALSLPLSGHLLLGQAVQQGAGWATGAAGILQTGTVTLRVVASFSEERLTLSTEHLDEGSLLDTHACLEATANAANACPSREAAPALGFLRTVPGGGLSVQIYVRGPVGVQAFSGADQHLLTIPNSMAAWRSEPLRIWAVFIGLLVGFWKHVTEFFNFLKKFWQKNPNVIETGEADKNGDGKQENSMQDISVEQEDERQRNESRKRTDDSISRAIALVLVLVSFTPGLASTSAHAEPVEIRQGTYTGAGYSFRRGAACLVVTARHVVSEIGVPVTVLDRTGAKAEASRSYDNESYDLALITLHDSPPAVACTTTWPDVAWLRRASFSTGSEFQAIRHYPGGKESIVRLNYAGGTKDRLTLAPVDKLNIIESDSGAIVMLDGRPAGIVQSIDTGTDRINVLRIDVIDQLVGDRFRGSSGGRVVSYAGVLWRGRENPTWSTYVQAWLTEKAGRTVIPASRTAGVAPPAACEVKVEVLSWDHVSAPNPEFDSVQLQLKACGKRGFIYETMCKGAQTLSASTPRQVQTQKIALNVTVTPSGAASLSKLTTSTHVPQSGKLSKMEIELGSLLAAVGPTLTDLLARGACD